MPRLRIKSLIAVRKSQIFFVVGLPLLMVTLLWTLVNFFQSQQENPVRFDLAKFSDDQICDKGVANDPDVADFFKEKLKRKLSCGDEGLIPSPTCIKSLIENTASVPLSECVVEAHTVMGEFKEASVFGDEMRTVELETMNQQVFVSYLPNFSTNINARNWPISLEVNRGGSGWFSYLAIYGVNNEDHVELFFMQAKGDRCNDGYAQWETNPTDHFGSAHAWTSATPFRLLNPFDDTNWRQAFFASQFTSDDLQKQRESLFDATGKRPHRGWYPYYDISNCAICCAGKLLIKQSFIGNIFQEKDFQVVGVLLDMDEIKTLKDSSLRMDQCFADTLFNQSIPDEEAVNLPENSKFFSVDNWMKFRTQLDLQCTN